MARIVRPQGADPALAWELCCTPAGAFAGPDDLPDDVRWFPAAVPGTAAAALTAAGAFDPAAPRRLHDQDIFYRTRLRGNGPHVLRLGGLATIAEAWIDGALLFRSRNMFHEHQLPVRLNRSHSLVLAFRSLDADLAGRRGRGAWRPRMIAGAGLRHARTTLLGMMPGWCPEIHAIGPWRAVTLSPATELDGVTADLRTSADGEVTLRLTAENGFCGSGESWLEVGARRTWLHATDPNTVEGRLRVPQAARWWPRTHGAPCLHSARAGIGRHEIDLGRIGFRHIEIDRGADGAGFGLRVNGEKIFCRGACWTPPDLLSLSGHRESYLPSLLRMRDAGMNMVRVSGTMLYEDDAFYTLCDELGLLVWQDFMFANFDYPAGDPDFLDSVGLEARQFLDRTQASPSLAVLCGGSEVMQQAAMLGAPRERWSNRLFDETLPDLVQRLRPDVPYVPNSPCGGDWPFQPGQGVAHYYGVGAYLRPPEDARRAGVRFASECLAFANVPCARTVAEMASPFSHHPRWKQAVPRDAGASWDFEDVRDHYLASLYGQDVARLRYEDPERYLDLSRAVAADLMEAVFAEWRRVGSACAGGLVWTLQDFVPGAGWGVIDALGRPKSTWHALRRVFRLRQVVLTDEGLNGLDIHVLNESAEPLEAELRLSCLRGGETVVARAERQVCVPPHGTLRLAAASLLDRFFDIAYAYRFGPPAHDVTCVHLLDAKSEVIAEACHFPRTRLLPTGALDLRVDVEQDDAGWWLRLAARRFAQHVQIRDDFFLPAEDGFHLSPLHDRRVRLVPAESDSAPPPPAGSVRATNLARPVHYQGRP